MSNAVGTQINQVIEGMGLRTDEYNTENRKRTEDAYACVSEKPEKSLIIYYIW